MSQSRKQKQRDRRHVALASYANRTQQIVRELHPNQESTIERVVTFAKQPKDLNTYGLKAALGVMLYRVWLYSGECMPATEYAIRRRECMPLVDNGRLRLF